MAVKKFWLSYDLGLKGDYKSLYIWLDKHKAKECGDSFAFFEFESSSSDPREEIRNDFKENSILFNPTDRVYLIWNDDLKKAHGSFIIGHRQRAPWEGYFSTDTDQSIDS